jgi:ribosomal protein L30E
LEKKTKLETFIGFSIKSGKYKIGGNACKTLKKASLMIVCESISENSKKDAISLSKKLGCKIYRTVGVSLESLTKRENAKVMAITDVNLSDAVVKESNNQLAEICQEI